MMTLWLIMQFCVDYHKSLDFLIPLHLFVILMATGEAVLVHRRYSR